MGYLPYDTKYTKEQLIHAKRALDDFETMEVLLYSIIKFVADAKLAPEALTKLSDLLAQVQVIRNTFSKDIKE